MANDAARIEIRRDWNVRDEAGNAYGILDVHPGPDDPAILLGVRLAATGEQTQVVLRPEGVLDRPGLRLRVAELSTDDPARVVLVPDAG